MPARELPASLLFGVSEGERSFLRARSADGLGCPMQPGTDALPKEPIPRGCNLPVLQRPLVERHGLVARTDAESIRLIRRTVASNPEPERDCEPLPDSG